MFKRGDTPIPGYTLKGRLGRGTFGEVWRASKENGPDVALKFVDLRDRPGWKEFQGINAVLEGLAAKGNNIHLVAIHSLWLIDENQNILQTAKLGTLRGSNGTKRPASQERPRETLVPSDDAPEEVSGPESGAPSMLIIEQQLGESSLKPRPSGIPVEELLRYMEQAANALDHLNCRQKADGTSATSILHCDVKPANMLLIGRDVLICDYGLAQTLDADQDNLQATSQLGSRAYMSPECLNRNPNLRTDQYSLAITYYELRTGSLPYSDEALATGSIEPAILKGQLCFDKVTDDERTVLKKATALQPQHRFESAAEFVNALRIALEPKIIVPRQRPLMIAGVLSVCLAGILLLLIRPSSNAQSTIRAIDKHLETRDFSAAMTLAKSLPNNGRRREMLKIAKEYVRYHSKSLNDNTLSVDRWRHMMQEALTLAEETKFDAQTQALRGKLLRSRYDQMVSRPAVGDVTDYIVRAKGPRDDPARWWRYRAGAWLLTMELTPAQVGQHTERESTLRELSESSQLLADLAMFHRRLADTSPQPYASDDPEPWACLFFTLYQMKHAAPEMADDCLAEAAAIGAKQGGIWLSEIENDTYQLDVEVKPWFEQIREFYFNRYEHRRRAKQSYSGDSLLQLDRLIGSSGTLRRQFGEVREFITASDWTRADELLEEIAHELDASSIHNEEVYEKTSWNRQLVAHRAWRHVADWTASDVFSASLKDMAEYARIRTASSSTIDNDLLDSVRGLLASRVVKVDPSSDEMADALALCNLGLDMWPKDRHLLSCVVEMHTNCERSSRTISEEELSRKRLILAETVQNADPKSPASEESGRWHTYFLYVVSIAEGENGARSTMIENALKASRHWKMAPLSQNRSRRLYEILYSHLKQQLQSTLSSNNVALSDRSEYQDAMTLVTAIDDLPNDVKDPRYELLRSYVRLQSDLPLTELQQLIESVERIDSDDELTEEESDWCDLVRWRALSQWPQALTALRLEQFLQLTVAIVHRMVHASSEASGSDVLRQFLVPAFQRIYQPASEPADVAVDVPDFDALIRNLPMPSTLASEDAREAAARLHYQLGRLATEDGTVTKLLGKGAKATGAYEIAHECYVRAAELSASPDYLVAQGWAFGMRNWYAPDQFPQVVEELDRIDGRLQNVTVPGGGKDFVAGLRSLFSASLRNVAAKQREDLLREAIVKFNKAIAVDPHIPEYYEVCCSAQISHASLLTATDQSPRKAELNQAIQYANEGLKLLRGRDSVSSILFELYLGNAHEDLAFYAMEDRLVNYQKARAHFEGALNTAERLLEMTWVPVAKVALARCLCRMTKVSDNSDVKGLLQRAEKILSSLAEASDGGATDFDRSLAFEIYTYRAFVYRELVFQGTDVDNNRAKGISALRRCIPLAQRDLRDQAAGLYLLLAELEPELSDVRSAAEGVLKHSFETRLQIDANTQIANALRFVHDRYGNNLTEYNDWLHDQLQVYKSQAQAHKEVMMEGLLKLEMLQLQVPATAVDRKDIQESNSSRMMQTLAENENVPVLERSRAWAVASHIAAKCWEPETTNGEEYAEAFRLMRKAIVCLRTEFKNPIRSRRDIRYAYLDLLDNSAAYAAWALAMKAKVSPKEVKQVKEEIAEALTIKELEPAQRKRLKELRDSL